LIKEIVEAVKSLADSLSLRPLSTIGALLILFIAYIGYRNYEVIKDLRISPEQEMVLFERKLVESSQIMDSLRLLQKSLGAHSIIIKQFHNGKHDLTGLPFTSASPTYYTPSYDMGRERPLSYYDKSLHAMWGTSIGDPKCTIIKTPVDNYTSIYMEAYNLDRVVMCPLTNLLKYPVGIIVVGFSAGNTKSSDILALRKTRDIAGRVSGYLQNEDI